MGSLRVVVTVHSVLGVDHLGATVFGGFVLDEEPVQMSRDSHCYRPSFLQSELQSIPLRLFILSLTRPAK